MPIKRTEALQPLSRQHHNGLLFCLLLQKGIKKNADPEVMRDFIQDFWYKDLQHHFQLEELYLVPLKNRYHQFVEPLQQMVNEHYELKSIINEIVLNPTHKTIDELRKKLDDHVRFEERQLFPLIEEAISPQELQTIGKILAKENDANCMSYSIRFWE